MTALLIAVIALFGDTSSHNKLNGLGKTLFVLIFVASTFNLITLIVEENEKVKKEVGLVEAKDTVYYRLVGDIEEAKHAFLWKDYNVLTKPTEFLDYENTPSIFMHPSVSDISEIDTKLIGAVESFIRSMSLAYETNREYLSFEEADSLSHFLQTMKIMKVHKVLSEYDESHGEFSEYLISHNLYHDRLKYLFLSLYALEKDIKEAKVKNEEQFYKLRPECEDPDDVEIMVSCI